MELHLCEVSKVPDFHSAPLPLRPGRLSGEAAVGKSGMAAWKAIEEIEGIPSGYVKIAIENGHL